MKSKLYVLILSLLMCFTLLPSFALSATEPSFYLSASVNQTMIGQEVQITVGGNDVKDVYGYEIRLKYDPEKLRFKKANSLWAGFTVPAMIKDGEITFAHTKTGNAAGENGAVDIATLSFESIGQGEAVFELTRIKLVNSKVDSATYETNVETLINVTSRGEVGQFSDISNHWAKEAIIRAATLGWINGYPDGSFRPEGKVSRAEFTAMLTRAISLQSIDGLVVNFADFNRLPQWAKPYILEAASAGVIKGYEDSTFRAEQLITRSEITVMIMRTLDDPIDDGRTSTFSDANQIPEWAYASVVSATEIGLIQGRGHNLFAPNDDTSRAEAVTLILRLLDYSK